MTRPPREIPPAVAVLRHYGDALTAAEKLVLPFVSGFCERHDQRVPRTGRYVGAVCGRGFGKSWMIAREIVRLVLAGDAPLIALVGPVEERVFETQIPFLIDASPPWCKPEVIRGRLVWPNGAEAYIYTAEVPDIRGPSFSVAWLTELVAWPSTTRKACFENVSTATRDGIARIFWDTTSKGQNEVILALRQMHREDPVKYPIIRGIIFDNPIFTTDYLRDQLRIYPPGRRRNEELYGRIYSESAGALWRQPWIDDNRRPVPTEYRVKIVSIDPALTTGKDADEFGICVACDDKRGDVFLLKDLSAKLEPDAAFDLVIDECEAGASGVIYETNRGGQLVIATLRSRARARGFEIVDWPLNNGKPFPPKRPGVIYGREIRTQDSKETRATGAASQAQLGCVHHCGSFDALEHEMTNWVPGDSRSPNRLDAAAYAVLELSGLLREQRPKTPSNMTGAAAASRKLTERLRVRASTRRLGL